jgi:non-homologous end joining protein Ku
MDGASSFARLSETVPPRALRRFCLGAHSVRTTQSVERALELANHIVTQKAADFEPEKFEDHYEEALIELINAKRSGKTIGPKPGPGART